jgi:hypothetical protein
VEKYLPSRSCWNNLACTRTKPNSVTISLQSKIQIIIQDNIYFYLYTQAASCDRIKTVSFSWFVNLNKLKYICIDTFSWKFEEKITFSRRKKGIKDVKLIVTLEYPVKMTSSPSSRNFLSNPFKESEFCPFHVNSSKHPRASGS